MLLSLRLFAIEEVVVHSVSDSLRTVIENTKTPEDKIQALGRLARRTSSDDPEGASKLAQQMLQLATETDNRAGIAAARNVMGSIFFYRGEYDEALVEWEHSYSLYARLDSLDARGTHSLSLANALNNMGIVHKRQGDLPKALDLYYSALKIREEIKEPYPIGSSYLNIGGLYKSQGRPQEAALFFQKARKLFEEAGDVYGQAAVLNNLGNIYEQQDDGLELAAEAYTAALALFEKAENERGVGLGLNNLGIILQLQGDCENALALFERSKEIREKTGDKAGVASVLQNIASCHSIQGNNTKAIEEYVRSLSLAEEDHMAKILIEGHKGIAKVYAANEQYDLAYLHQNQYQQLNDSLFTKKNDEALISIEKRYEEFRKTRAFANLDDRLTEQEASLNFRGNLITAMIISLIVIAGLLVVMFSRDKITRKLSMKLEERNLEVAQTNRHLRETQVSKEEKEELLKEIHHRVKNNLQIINSLLRFQSDMVKDPEVVALFTECQDRIISMSLLHEQLYRKEDLSFVNVTEYLTDLFEGLKHSYANNKKIEVNIRADVDSFGVNTMIPLGLLINEIASNSFKHGFKGRENGVIDLKLEKRDNKNYELLLSDNGIGIPGNIDHEEPETLGLELINIFVDQLEGHLKLSNHVGTSYKIQFTELKETIRHAER